MRIWIRIMLWITTLITTGVLVLHLPLPSVVAGMVLGCFPTLFLSLRNKENLKYLTAKTYQIIIVINNLVWVMVQLGVIIVILSGVDFGEFGLWNSAFMAFGVCNGYALSWLVLMTHHERRQSAAPVVSESGLFVPAYDPVRATANLVQLGLGAMILVVVLGLAIFLVI